VGIFTRTHRCRPPVPSNRIGVGEVVRMRWSGGPDRRSAAGLND